MQDTVADALEHEPGALLGDTQIRSELNRRNAFFEGGIERDRVKPLVQRHVAIAKHGADFHSALLAAITTLEEFAVSKPVGCEAAAVGAVPVSPVFAPALRFHKR